MTISFREALAVFSKGARWAFAHGVRGTIVRVESNDHDYRLVLDSVVDPPISELVNLRTGEREEVEWPVDAGDWMHFVLLLVNVHNKPVDSQTQRLVSEFVGPPGGKLNTIPRGLRNNKMPPGAWRDREVAESAECWFCGRTACHLETHYTGKVYRAWVVCDCCGGETEI